MIKRVYGTDDTEDPKLRDRSGAREAGVNPLMLVLTGMTNTPDPPDQPIPPRHPTPPVLVRGPIPAEWADLLGHLAVDLKRSRPQLIAEGVLLLLRFHQRGAGLPEPLPPVGMPAEGSDL